MDNNHDNGQKKIKNKKNWSKRLQNKKWRDTWQLPLSATHTQPTHTLYLPTCIHNLFDIIQILSSCYFLSYIII